MATIRIIDFNVIEQFLRHTSTALSRRYGEVTYELPPATNGLVHLPESDLRLFSQSMDVEQIEELEAWVGNWPEAINWGRSNISRYSDIVIGVCMTGGFSNADESIDLLPNLHEVRFKVKREGWGEPFLIKLSACFTRKTFETIQIVGFLDFVDE